MAACDVCLVSFQIWNTRFRHTLPRPRRQIATADFVEVDDLFSVTALTCGVDLAAELPPQLATSGVERGPDSLFVVAHDHWRLPLMVDDEGLAEASDGLELTLRRRLGPVRGCGNAVLGSAPSYAKLVAWSTMPLTGETSHKNWDLPR